MTELLRGTPVVSVIVPVLAGARGEREFRAFRSIGFGSVDSLDVEFILSVAGDADDELRADVEQLAADSRATAVFSTAPVGVDPLAVAFNRGAECASGRYLFLQDPAVVAPERFYQGLEHYAAAQLVDTLESHFAVVPVADLTHDAWLFAERERRVAPDSLSRSVVSLDAMRVEHVDMTLGCLLLHRSYYLALGGHDELAADASLDLRARLLVLSHRFPRSSVQRPPEHGARRARPYSTFAGQLYPYGFCSLMTGAVVARAPLTITGGEEGSRLRDVDMVEPHPARVLTGAPAPLCSSALPRRTLVLDPDAGVRNRFIQSLLGHVVVRASADLTLVGFERLLEREAIDTVVSTQPFASRQVQDCLQSARALGKEVVTRYRGLSHWQNVFDHTGYAFDSALYPEQAWDGYDSAPWVEALAGAHDVPGPAPGGLVKARKSGKRLIYIERPGDSELELRAAGGLVRSNKDYLELIHSIAALLGSDGAVVSNDKRVAQGKFGRNVQYAGGPPPRVVAQCDVVVTGHGSIGQRALLMNKPVVCLGPSFYAAPGLAQRARHMGHVFDAMQDPARHAPDPRRVASFFSFCMDRVFSSTRELETESGEAVYTRVNLLGQRMRLDPLTHRLDRRGLLSDLFPHVEHAALAGADTSAIHGLWQRSSRDTRGEHAITGLVKAAERERARTNGVIHSEARLLNLSQELESLIPMGAVRRLNKLRRDPHRFFEDSNVAVLRSARHLFKPHSRRR